MTPESAVKGDAGFSVTAKYLFRVLPDENSADNAAQTSGVLANKTHPLTG